MDFGQRLPPQGKSKYSPAEWHLWVYCCVWRLERGDAILAACEDPRPVLREVLRDLTGLTLESFTVSPPAGDAVIIFEGGYTLRLFSVYRKEHDSWMLFTPGRSVLVVGPGSGWVYGDSSKSPDSGSSAAGSQGAKDK